MPHPIQPTTFHYYEFAIVSPGCDLDGEPIVIRAESFEEAEIKAAASLQSRFAWSTRERSLTFVESRRTKEAA